ncbi:MAG: restriction endonuclease [bacterium]
MSTTAKGTKFENKVAELFRLMGYKVQRDLFIENRQIDILAEKTDGLITTKMIVECKDENKNIGIKKVQDFYNIVKVANVNRGIFISSKGFVRYAKSFAENKVDIDLFTYDEFANNLINFDDYIDWIIEDFENDELSRYYIDLDAEKRGEERTGTKAEILSPVDEYIDNWLKKETLGNRIAILGEYGSGKTSFSRHYAYKLAKRYKESKKDKIRIPILFNLGKFTKNVDFEDLIVGYLDRNCGVSNPKFNIFKKMNDEGLFLLIFDGFDEMAIHVDFDTITGNLKEIQKLTESTKSKVLLTSRPEYFISAKEEDEIFAPTSLLDKERRFDRLKLIPLNESQIKSFLKRRIPLIKEAEEDWIYYLEKIGEIHDLSDLSKRPVMLDMITKTLPQLIKEKKTINSANLYQMYLKGEIKRQAIDKKRKLLINREHRFVLMQTLAMHFYKENLTGVPVTEVKELIKDKFTPKQLEELEAHLRDFLTSSFLIRERDNYRFSHRSFVEYLTAKGLYDEIQKDKPYLFKINPLTKEIREFILELEAESEVLRYRIWRWIKNIKHKSFDAVQYLGSNAITLLNLLGEELKGKDFSNTILHNAYLHSADLTGTNFKEAVLKNANLNNTILKEADFSYADLEGVHLEEMGEVECVAFSKDGKYLASASKNNTVKVWEVAKLKEITTLKGHTGYVFSVAFSPDGRYLASASRDKTIKVWDVAKLKEITILKGHTESVFSITFSPDGRYLASASKDNTVKVWDVAKLKEITTLKGHTNVVINVAFSQDSRYLASASRDKTIKVWDIVKLKEITTLKGHTGSVYSVAFSQDGRYLASGSEDNTVKVWDAAKLKEITTLKGHINLVWSVAFSPNGKYLASASWDNTVKVWDVAKLKEITTLKGHTDSVRGVVFGPYSRYLASASLDKTIYLWAIDPKSKEFAKCLHILKQQINCEGMNIFQARGLSDTQKKFLLERGAIDKMIVPKLRCDTQTLISLLSKTELPWEDLSLLKKDQYEEYYNLLRQFAKTAESEKVRKNAMTVLKRQF